MITEEQIAVSCTLLGHAGSSTERCNACMMYSAFNGPTNAERGTWSDGLVRWPWFGMINWCSILWITGLQATNALAISRVPWMLCNQVWAHGEPLRRRNAKPQVDVDENGPPNCGTCCDVRTGQPVGFLRRMLLQTRLPKCPALSDSPKWIHLAHPATGTSSLDVSCD